MTSEIDNQVSTIERISLPIGVNCYINAAPTLPPLIGSLCYDKDLPNGLLIGNGTVWNPTAEPSGINGLGNNILSASLTKGGQPTFNIGSVNMGKITIVNGGGAILKFITVFIDQQITISAGGNWASNIGVITPDFLPSSTQFFPCTIYTGGGYVTTYFSIDATGAIILTVPAYVGDIKVYQLSGVYI